MSQNEERLVLNLEIANDLHHSFEVLASPNAESEDVAQANSFIQEVIQNDLVTFIHLCLTFLENQEEDSTIKYGTLILLRRSLRPTVNREMLSLQRILLSDESIYPILDHLYETLVGLTFGEDTFLQRAASEAFAHAFAVCESYGPFYLLPSTFFDSVKPQTLESALPTFTFFIDLFLTEYFDSKKSDLSNNVLLKNLIELIFSILSNDFIDSASDFESISSYIQFALETFYQMLEVVTTIFKRQPPATIIHFLLRAPIWLPKANEEIFSKTYEIINTIAQNFYEILLTPFIIDDDQNIYLRSDQVPDGVNANETALWPIIDELVDNGLSCTDEFLFITLNFWKSFSFFEFDSIFKKAYNIFLTHDEYQPINLKKPITDKGGSYSFSPLYIVKHKFSNPEILSNFIDFIFLMDPDEYEFGIPSNFRIPYTVSDTLKYIFLLAPNLIPYVLSEIVKPRLTSATWTDVHGALLILDAFCYKFKYHFGHTFFRDNIEFIASLMTNDHYNIIVGSTTIVIKKAVKLYGASIVPETIFENLLENLQNHLEIHHQSLLKSDLCLLKTLIKALPDRNVNELFVNFADVLHTLHTPDLPDILTFKLEDIMILFAEYTTSDKFEQIKDFFEKLKQKVSQTFDIASTSMEGIQPFINFITSTLDPLVIFYIRYPDLSSLQEIYELIYKFLQIHDPQLYFSCYLGFIRLITASKKDFSFACESILQSANDALDSQIPKLIGIAAQIIGSCFKYLELPDNDIPKQCADKIVHHLTEPINLETLQTNQKDLIKSLSEIIIGAPQDFSIQYYDIFMGTINEMIIYQVDQENEFEVASFQKLYTAIFDSLTNLVCYQNNVDPDHTDKSFLSWLKTSIFSKFLKKKVIDFEMYKNKNFLKSFFTFLENTARILGTKINIQLNNRYVNTILDYAYWCKWDDISERAKRVSELCKNS